MFNINYIKFMPSEYVMKYKNGKIVSEGMGLSFFYYAPSTSVVVVPVQCTDVPFMFEEVTEDFQTVSVQGQLTYRIVEYKKIAQLLNYTFDMKNHKYVVENAQKIAQRLVNIIKVLCKKHIEGMSIKTAIKSSDELSKQVSKEFSDTSEVKNLGLEILGFSILGIMPNKDTARALETQAREQILKDADEALYARRNASIDLERQVKENELNTEIAVEAKKKQIKETQLEAKRSVMQKENQIKDEELAFATELEAKKKELVELSVANAKANADARAYEIEAVMNAFAKADSNVMQTLATMGMNPDKLIASAFQNLASNADKIGQLNITPDLLQGLLGKK